MTVLDSACTFIKQFEGCCLSAYKDPDGVWTIGWGHTGPEAVPMRTWTQQQADDQLAADVGQHQQQLLAASPSIAALFYEQVALIDFVFNEGIGRYEMSTLKKLVDAGNFEQAAEEIQKWVYGNGVKLAGLVRRRAAEASLLYTSP
jgi:lysozyme